MSLQPPDFEKLVLQYVYHRLHTWVINAYFVKFLPVLQMLHHCRLTVQQMCQLLQPRDTSTTSRQLSPQP